MFRYEYVSGIRSRVFELFPLLVIMTLSIAMVGPVVEHALAADRIAFVVGISTYEHLEQLENPVHDARAMAQELRDLDFTITEGLNLTRQQFCRSWQSILDSATSEDTLLFFYSGHGVEIDEQNYLLPRDIPYFAYGRDAQFTADAIGVSQLLASLRSGDPHPPKVTVMIFDACRDNPTIPPEYKKSIGQVGGLVKIPAPQGTFIMYAAAPGKISLDRLGPTDKVKNSVYTRTLLPLLGNRSLSIQDLAIRTREKVYQMTQTMHYEQIPEYTDGIIGRFCLAGCADQPSPPKPNVPNQKVIGTRPTRNTGKDSAPMVLVPAGEFTMGSSSQDIDRWLQDHPNDQPSWFDGEIPHHSVHLDAFYIDQCEVTTSLYAKFFQETKRDPPRYWSETVLKQHGNKPVVGVDWNDAAAYCAWAGKRLPTEAEWEKAARGTDQRLYPWGNTAPNQNLTNFNKCCGFQDYEVLTDVGSFKGGKSPFGAYDMAGNVWEWVADWYDGNYYVHSPGKNPKGPSQGELKVLRGGSWYDVDARYLRSSDRFGGNPSGKYYINGFRCAQDACPGPESGCPWRMRRACRAGVQTRSWLPDYLSAEQLRPWGCAGQRSEH